jgi:TonB family protein
MKNLLCLCTLLLCLLHVYAAPKESAFTNIDSLSKQKEPKPVFMIVEVLPMFPGGQEAMLKFIAERLVYPEAALEEEIEGTVVVEFIVEEDGSLSNFKILKDIGGGCGEAALDVIKQMPNWVPGTQRNVPVRVYMKVPLRFKLQNASKKKRR